MIRRAALVAVVLVASCAAYLFVLPFWIHPVAWTPAADPGWSGVFAPRDSTPAFNVMPAPAGPEDVAFGPDGRLYAGVADGRIIRFAMDGSGMEDVAATDGRPLGLGFNSEGELFVTVHGRGLVQVSRDGDVTLLAGEADGVPIAFADDIDFGPDGVVWFSDLTTRLPNDLHIDYWEGSASGRLLTWDPSTRATRVQSAGLQFPNGVALGPDGRYVLVCETMAARVVRIWLAGRRAGEREIFVDALPGYVDNISFDGRGMFWVALVGTRNPGFERLARYPALRRVVARIPGDHVPRAMPWFPDGESGGCVIAVDTTGVVRACLHDPAGEYQVITSVNRYGDSLFLGSISYPGVAAIALPDDGPY